MTVSPMMSEAPVLTGYDYFDFGCSAGANIELVSRADPQLRGLGIDIDMAKIALARGKGLDAVGFDIRKIPNKKLVDFVTMSHFLEHLGGVGDARAMITKAIQVAREFVLIRQPWFDADGEMFRSGLKFYWSHWRGHSNRMGLIDFQSILQPELDANRIHSFEISGRGPVPDSSHDCVIPLETPVDQHKYEPARHGPKPEKKIKFLVPAYREVVVMIDLTGNNNEHPIVSQIRPFESIRVSGR